MSEFDKKLKRNINDVKRGIRNLRKMGFKIERTPTETMVGSVVDHIYVIDYMTPAWGTQQGRVILQKHLFTV